jgi:hypothetical protein
VGQYPILARIVNTRQISLKNCWVFLMDEHCDDNGVALPPDHPLSFRNTFNELFTRMLQLPTPPKRCAKHWPVQLPGRGFGSWPRGQAASPSASKTRRVRCLTRC